MVEFKDVVVRMPAKELESFMQAVRLAHKQDSKGVQDFPKACADIVLSTVKKSIVWQTANASTGQTIGALSYSTSRSGYDLDT